MTLTPPVTTGDTLPPWDLDSIFPGPDSQQFRTALEEAARRIAELEALFDRHRVGARSPSELYPALATSFEEIVAAYDAVLEAAFTLDGYLSCLTAADASNEAASAAESEWRERKTGLARLAPRFVAWVGALDVAALVAASAVARAHEPALQRLQAAAAHAMTPGEEELAALLGPSGAAAWMDLHRELTAMATAHIEIDGETQHMSLSEIENLGYLPDRDVRRRGHEAANDALRQLSPALAAALNGIKGQQLTLARRRGWEDPLDEALFANAIDRPILDAMFAAMREALPDYRRYLRAKARLLGLPVLAGYDLFAPVGAPAPWPFDTARDFIVAQFSDFSPKMGALAARAFAEQWLDAPPRVGKEGGAFCTGVGGDGSRILLNYLPVGAWMTTTAHELGHAYHNFVSAEQRRTHLQAPSENSPTAFPLTLAETASTICEIAVQRAAANAVERPEQQVAQLEEWLQLLTLSVFGIMPAFAFERALFATRAQRELSPAELEALMAAAWREAAGDAIDPETVWSMSWTMGHFFIDSTSFYNFPYAFGMLFSLGLLASRDANPDGFFDRFDLLLADSGMRDANDLAAPFAIDLRDPAFWRTSLDAFRADVVRYEALAEGVGHQ